MKRIIVNANQKEHIRIAIAEDGVIDNIQSVFLKQKEREDNIYKGVVFRIEQHLEAAFIDFDGDKQGFLPFKNIPPSFFDHLHTEKDDSADSTDIVDSGTSPNNANSTDDTSDADNATHPDAKNEGSISDEAIETVNTEEQNSITQKNLETEKKKKNKVDVGQLLKVGDEIIVQVEKEERSNKGVYLTANISLPGIHTVLLPLNPAVRGVPSQVPSAKKQELKQLFKELKIPKGMGVIMRTGSTEQGIEHFQWSIEYLSSLWRAIESFAKMNKAPCLIYSENTIIKILRNYLRNDIDEVLVDDSAIYEDIKNFSENVMDGFSKRVKLYGNEKPILSAFGLENQAQSILQRTISLPSGGSLVFDQTEALIAIDINSSRSKKGQNIEETALTTNLEAANEIALQLRLRDIGGLIVIDFIDMKSAENRQAVRKAFGEAIKKDKARMKISESISSLGLLELSRQRTTSSIADTTQQTCPQCTGVGFVPTVEAMAVATIRSIQYQLIVSKEESGEEKEQNPYKKMLVYVPTKVSTYLSNEKRNLLWEIEQSSGCKILVIPNPNFNIPHYSIEVFNDKGKVGQSSHHKQPNLSYTIPQNQITFKKSGVDASKVRAPKKPKKGFWSALFALFQGSEKTKRHPAGRKNYGKQKRYSNYNRNTKRHPQQRNNRYQTETQQITLIARGLIKIS